MTINMYKAIQEMEGVIKIQNITVIFKNWVFMHMQKNMQTVFQKLRFMIISHGF